MLKINKKAFLNQKLLATLLALVFFGFHFGQADENKLSYFEDQDGDGLTNQEELSLGTDPQKEDSDGDGYTDGVEVSSGYNPLKPAPGDKLIPDENNSAIETKENKTNLTEEFIEKLKNEKGNEIETLRKYSTGELDEDGLQAEEALLGASLTEEEVKDFVSEIFQEVDIEEEVEIIPEEELKILPEPGGNEEKKKEIEKKQIDEYFAMVGFLLSTNLPFEAKTEEDFNTRMDDYIAGLGQDITEGDAYEASKTKRETAEMLAELKEVEVPFVLKDIHQRWLSVVKFILEQDESVIFEKNDPIAMGLMASRIQAALDELSDLEYETAQLMEKYEEEEVVDSEKEESEN